eukprot:GHVL01013802.1.p1 GENE.GHVL01013802.1~~GHVL01013802.1.p1  ORF type:complete len:160 (-),score=30.34 GHVL01013802.1:37-516(-)
MNIFLHHIWFILYIFLIFLFDIFLFCFGIIYIFRKKWMYYHQSAVDIEWNNLPKKIKILILTYINMIGCLLIIISLLIFIFIFFYIIFCDKTIFILAPLITVIVGFGILYCPFILVNTLKPAIRPPIMAGLWACVFLFFVTSLSINLPRQNRVCINSQM